MLARLRLPFPVFSAVRCNSTAAPTDALTTKQWANAQLVVGGQMPPDPPPLEPVARRLLDFKTCRTFELYNAGRVLDKVIF
jgi:hypothetical protein